MPVLVMVCRTGPTYGLKRQTIDGTMNCLSRSSFGPTEITQGSFGLLHFVKTLRYVVSILNHHILVSLSLET